jgi:hypothetical protein
VFFVLNTGIHFFGAEHAKDNFTNEVIATVMQRIRKNYESNPDMGLWDIGHLR